jgi:hypothetical protein
MYFFFFFIYIFVGKHNNLGFFMKFLISMIFLVILAQVSFAEIKENKPDFLPPYNRNINTVQKEVEEWIAREKANVSKRDTFVALKTDLLGRHLSSGTVELLKKSRKASQSEQKRLVVISDLHIPYDEPVDEISGRYEYDAATDMKKYFINGQEISEKDYLNYVEKSWKEFGERKKGRRNLRIPGEIRADAVSWTAWMTANEISELLDKNKELAVRDYVEPQNSASRPTILALTQLSTHAFFNSYYGNGIGVKFNESGCPNLVGSGINTSNYIQGNSCTAINRHATAVARVLQMASPNAKIYGYEHGAHPANPFSKSPPIEIGSHSYQIGSSQNYSDYDMDHYIHQDRVIEFVAAGNNIVNVNVTTPGKAVNAITVGAVEPETGSYADYSCWRNSEVLNEKPEVAAYTNVDFSDNSVLVNMFAADNRPPIFNGTSAATPLLAGFTATLLEQHGFFKRRPALVKALYLTGSTVPINGSHDSDNSKSAKALIPYSSVAWNTRSWFCEGANAACFKANDTITITENNIQANRRYRIAVAWLTPANYVNQNKRLSQDIDLYVYQNGKLVDYSESWYNPFEVVDFVTTSNAPLKIVIKRYRNTIGQGDNVILGYNLWIGN